MYTMKLLQEYIKEVTEPFNPEWDYVIEMAAIGNPILNRINHFIAVHDTRAGDRKRPHIHIYLKNDIRPFNKFNFEIALDELNLIRMRDQSRNIDRRNRDVCSWSNYTKLKNDFEDWIFDKPTIKGDFIDNLDAIIYFYNFESGDDYTLLNYIREHGLRILNKYKKYFTEDDIELYNDCF